MRVAAAVLVLVDRDACCLGQLAGMAESKELEQLQQRLLLGTSEQRARMLAGCLMPLQRALEDWRLR